MNKRIQALVTTMQDGLLIVHSAAMKTRSNDTEYPYRASSNLFYLTGFKEENAALLVEKNGDYSTAVLFVEPFDEKKALWLGERAGIDGAKAQCDVDEVLSIKQLDEEVSKRLVAHQRLYIEFTFMQESNVFNWIDQDRDNREVKIALRAIEDASLLIESLRLRKESSEIKTIEQALQITIEAHNRVMKALKPDMYEYEIQALYEYTFKRLGASWDAYTTIVAGGNSANTLHYIANDKRLQDGELVLIDAGCEYELYASDITRTYPVNGKFSDAQRQVYQKVLDVQKSIIEMIQPGVLVTMLKEAAERLLCTALVELGILHGEVETLLQEKAHKRYYPHGIGHWMGLDVHDQAPYYDTQGNDLAMQAGMIITIEPGLYLKEDDTSIPEQFRGIGIRIEDDILVTENGYENLSKAMIKEIDDIEAYMA